MKFVAKSILTLGLVAAGLGGISLLLPKPADAFFIGVGVPARPFYRPYYTWRSDLVPAPVYSSVPVYSPNVVWVPRHFVPGHWQDGLFIPGHYVSGHYTNL